ncbi:hypothetical protein P3X46_006675 [Hevea brasiliensis]|uniref:F-box domain-containing protein n=1 Tax=Hevea brasiliensis TaxID=3981 RepID=A0ABQ9MTH9_HEVBR|nr:hypothetical protein P3X46_006675 [Hevea brasiliensis]
MKNLTASSSASKRSFKTMNNNNQDMFSMLSSHLLVLIVSYLPLKEAVRTSILSKQWRNIWRQTTKLEFHEKPFVNLKETNENQRIQRSSFFDFIKRLLTSYPKKDIRKFSLACSKPKDFFIDVQNFVIFTISRNVRELELDFSCHTLRLRKMWHDPIVYLINY